MTVTVTVIEEGLILHAAKTVVLPRDTEAAAQNSRILQ